MRRDRGGGRRCGGRGGMGRGVGAQRRWESNEAAQRTPRTLPGLRTVERAGRDGHGGRGLPWAGPFLTPRRGSGRANSSVDEPAVLSPVAVVDEARCLGCRSCCHVSPEGAIHVESVAKVDRELCTGCGRCMAACLQRAIFLHPRREVDLEA